jgi:hypothetical protein
MAVPGWRRAHLGQREGHRSKSHAERVEDRVGDGGGGDGRGRLAMWSPIPVPSMPTALMNCRRVVCHWCSNIHAFGPRSFFRFEGCWSTGVTDPGRDVTGFTDGGVSNANTTTVGGDPRGRS